MNVIQRLVAAAVLAAVPLAAQAADMSYTYLDGGLARVDLDGVSRTLDGFFLRGSVSLTDNLFLSGDYVDVSKSGVDFEQYSVGLGGRFPLSDALDLTTRIAWVQAEAGVRAPPFSARAKDDGFSVGAGLRGRLGERFELEGNVTYYDVGDGDDTSLGVAVRYFFTRNIAVGADYQRFDDAKLWGLGLRVSLGR
jgi:hypothetical protein